MVIVHGRSTTCCSTRCAQMPIAQRSKRQEGARTSNAASRRTRSAEMAQMLVCRLFGLARFSDLTCDGEGIGAHRRRGALGRASPMSLDRSSKSIDSGELPKAVAGQATLVLARGNAQRTDESTMCGGVCQACAGVCKHVPSGETNGGAFLQPLHIPASPNCHQCITVRPVMPIRLHCPSHCIQYARDDYKGCFVNGSVWI